MYPAPQSQTKWQWLRLRLWALTGILYLWVTLGTLLGYIIVFAVQPERAATPLVINGQPQYDRDGTPIITNEFPANCYPHYEMAWLETKCENDWAERAWLVAVDLPTFISSFFSVALGMILRGSLESLVWIGMSFVTGLFFFYPGFRYCKCRSPYVAWGSLAGWSIPVLLCAYYS